MAPWPAYLFTFALAAWWFPYWAGITRRFWLWGVAFGSTLLVWVMVAAVLAVAKAPRVLKETWECST